MPMKHEELSRKILQVFYEVYNELGGGFLESVYEASLRIALIEAGLEVRPKGLLNVYFRGHVVGTFQPDILVNDVIILEIKACRALDSAHEAQLLNYLRATSAEVGLLLNFGSKPEIKRIVLDNERKGRQRPTALPPDTAAIASGGQKRGSPIDPCNP